MSAPTQPAKRTSVLAGSFDRAAHSYLAHARVQMAMAEWLAQWLPVDRSGNALEMGAGPGIFTQFLLPWSGNLTATDLSPKMCAAGSARVPEAIWQAMEAESPSAGPWDWIFSSSMLQWVADPADVFAAWRSRLAPGGRILAGLFAAESLPEWSTVAGGTAPLTWRTVEQWRNFLARAGLRVERDQSERRTSYHASARAFLRSLHGVGAAPTRSYPAGLLRRLLHDYEGRHLTSKGVTATWTLYRFEATR
jgi:malonyl-CoA O-methyltransferase